MKILSSFHGDKIISHDILLLVCKAAKGQLLSSIIHGTRLDACISRHTTQEGIQRHTRPSLSVPFHRHSFLFINATSKQNDYLHDPCGRHSYVVINAIINSTMTGLSTKYLFSQEQLLYT